MSEPNSLISEAFLAFSREAPQHAEAWTKLVQQMAKSSALDPKVRELAHLSVLAVLRLESGIPFHVQCARQAGATRDEVISAILVGMPAAGHSVIQVLPTVLEAME